MSQKVTVNEILAKIYHIEERINLVEENVKSVQDPVLKDGVEVTGSLELSQLNIVDISVLELINIYNEVPQILNNVSIQVSLTAESYRQQTGNDIYLENNKQGNYWIIATENDTFWLVPKLNIKINSNIIRNLEYLFKCDGYQSNTKNDFALVKPGKIIAVGNLWKLETPGELDFTKTFKTVDFLTEINQLKQELQEVKQQFKEFPEINQFKQELQEVKQKINEIPAITQLQEEIQQLKQQLGGQFEQINNHQTEINQLQEEIQQLKQQLEGKFEEINQKLEIFKKSSTLQLDNLIQFKKSSTLQLEKLIEDYNTNPNLLAAKAIIVKETDLSFNQRQKGNISNITFESTERGIRGIYWILTINDQYYLVYDKMRVKINDYNVKNVRSIFQCWGYQEGTQRDFDFKLIKPARVILINTNQWELVETGIIHGIN